MRAIIARVHPGGRVSRHVLHGWALTASLIAAPQSVPPPPAFDELLSELAAKLAAVVDAAAPLHLVSVSAGRDDRTSMRELAGDLARMLARRGLRVSERADSATVVSFTCSRNLRERVCAAEVRRGKARDVVIATRAYQTAALRPAAPMPVVLELRPLLSHSEPILDAVFVDRRLLVLDPSALTLFEKSADGWRRLVVQPLPTPRPWPRDVRGRLRMEGAAFEAFLPGVTCRGTLEALGVACTGEPRPWPVGIENTGIASGRNVFVMSDGRTYFSSAPLESDAGARWLLAADNGQLVFLDEARRPIESMTGFGGDVAALSTACAPGSHVVASDSEAERGLDTLHAFRVTARQLVAAAPPITLPGPVTALWTMATGDAAIAVARNPATAWYDAFQIGLSCGR